MKSLLVEMPLQILIIIPFILNVEKLNYFLTWVKVSVSALSLGSE